MRNKKYRGKTKGDWDAFCKSHVAANCTMKVLEDLDKHLQEQDKEVTLVKTDGADYYFRVGEKVDKDEGPLLCIDKIVIGDINDDSVEIIMDNPNIIFRSLFGDIDEEVKIEEVDENDNTLTLGQQADEG